MVAVNAEHTSFLYLATVQVPSKHNLITQIQMNGVGTGKWYFYSWLKQKTTPTT